MCDVNIVNSVCIILVQPWQHLDVSEWRPQTASPLCPSLHKSYATDIPQDRLRAAVEELYAQLQN